MGKRFSNLEDTYNTLIAGGFDINQLPANNKYRKYAEWKQDPDRRRLPEESKQATGKRKRAGIVPFGLQLNPANQYDVGMSTRAFNALNGLGGAALYGLETQNLDNYIPRPSFSPAKAILAVRRGTPIAVPASQNRITGQPYKRTTGESYTIPFGRSTGNALPIEAEQTILDTVTETHAVSFEPEFLRRR